MGCLYIKYVKAIIHNTSKWPWQGTEHDISRHNWHLLQAFALGIVYDTYLVK